MDPKMFSGKSQSQQVGEIWKYLEHLAQNDPEGYSKFIKKTLDDGAKQGLGPPEHFFCIKTQKMPKVIPVRAVYINACKWKQVPPPKSETASIPMIASEMREELISGHLCFVIDVALNPETIEECVKKEEEKQMLIKLLIRYTEDLTKLSLNSDFQLLEDEYVGNRDSLLDLMCPDALKTAARESSGSLSDEKLIDHLKKVDLSINDDKAPSIALHSNQSNENRTRDILMPTHLGQNSDAFIKETKHDLNNDNNITSKNDALDNEATFKAASELEAGKEQIAKYTKTEEKKDGVNYLIIKVELPDVLTMKDCDVEINENSIDLLVPGKYKLNLKLNSKVDEEHADAIFVRKTSLLILKMKCL